MSNQERKQVMKMFYDGMTMREIAEKFGVNRSTIREIIKNELKNN